MKGHAIEYFGGPYLPYDVIRDLEAVDEFIHHLFGQVIGLDNTGLVGVVHVAATHKGRITKDVVLVVSILRFNQKLGRSFVNGGQPINVKNSN
jgi:hypothetical protein